jgi:NAD(P)-dependent dehydrogenase (short-subunit alcohol dehydrogenase family)
MSVLRGRVVVVTGASRGIGKGIALALGEAGATVYVSGRSDAGGTTEGLPGTVGDTAAEVTRRGGQGVAVRCDHMADAEVEALFARVEQEQSRLDVLVNNAWGGYEQFDWSRFGAPSGSSRCGSGPACSRPGCGRTWRPPGWPSR